MFCVVDQPDQSSERDKLRQCFTMIKICKLKAKSNYLMIMTFPVKKKYFFWY